MSKGSPIVYLRLPEELMDTIEDCVNSANEKRKGEPYTVSSWIRAAIAEKIAHVARSKGESEPIRHVVHGEHERLELEEE